MLVAQSCPTLCDPMDCSPPGSSIHEIFPGKGTGMGCHFLLQGIFPTEGSNPGLPHCRQKLYHLSHQWSPRNINKSSNKDQFSSVQFSHSVVSDSLWPHGLYSPWNSPGHNTGVGSLSLLQRIFPTEGSNPGLPHCRRFFTRWTTREAQEYWSG